MTSTSRAQYVKEHPEEKIAAIANEVRRKIRINNCET